MNTILRVGDCGIRFWLGRKMSCLHRETNYFRMGSDELFIDSPTWFDTKEEAIAAAEAMGFTVMQ